MNFCAARKLGPPWPPAVALSSLTTVPAWARGDGFAKADHPPGGPRRPGPDLRGGRSRAPAQARAVSTGFFLAAMIPLNEGYRGSLIFSTTLITAGQGWPPTLS